MSAELPLQYCCKKIYKYNPCIAVCKACFICKTPPKFRHFFYSSVGGMGLPQLQPCVFGECVDIMKCTGRSDACYIVTLALCRYLLLQEY